MNKVDNCLHRYGPTLYNELGADKKDQIYISVVRKRKNNCMNIGVE